MQWTHAFVLLATLAIISASDPEVRSKRDLKFIKKLLLAKIFGTHKNVTTTLPKKPANYRLFRIPGFDNILVKAVPKVPEVLGTNAPPPSVLEVTESEPVPVHPSIQIVSNYLGTNNLNDTLFALKGVKNLLASGVLTAKREGVDNIESSKIVVDETLRPIMVYPSLRETIMERYRTIPRYSSLLIPSEYSYKQINKDRVMTYTAHDNQNVMVTESKRPVPLPPSISYRIQDILSLGTSRLLTSPVVRVKTHPGPIPVFDTPKVEVTPSSGYTYNQLHNDGSVTSYSGSGHVEEHEGHTPVVITEVRHPTSVVLAEMEGHPAPIPVLNIPQVQGPVHSVKAPSHSSGYSYKHLHNDGSMTTYSGSGHIVKPGEERATVVITEPGRPTVVVADSQGPPASFSSGYIYNHVHNNGTVTASFGSDHIAVHEGVQPGVVITEPGRPTVVVTDVKGPPAPFPVYNIPKVKVPSGSGYSYNHVHNDGSVTTYSGSGHVAEHQGEKSAVVITELGRPTVVVADSRGPPAPFPVFNVPNVQAPSSSGYSYNHVHNDGSVTTYTGSGHVVEEHQGEKSAVVITEPGRPTVVVADSRGPPAPFPVFNVPNVKAPSSAGYSYNHVHNDGSMTTYTGSGHVVAEHQGEKSAVVITEPGRPTVVVADSHGPPAPFPVFNIPNVKAPSSSGYLYNHVHSDGSMTTYTGSGHVVEEHQGEKSAVVITEPGRPTVVVADSHGPPAPFPVFNVPNVKAPSSSGYSYNHVHNDGSMTTYTGSGHVVEEHQGEKSAVVITEPGRPTVVVADSHGPTAPFPVFNVPNVKAPSSSGYSYNHVHNDGSMTTYTGSGHVVAEHQGEKSAVVITEPGRPTVVVADSHGPPAPFPVFNIPNVKAPNSSGYLYNHVHNDGSVTTYTGSGHVVAEHQGEKSAVVITEPGRPTVVVADSHGPTAPFPVFNVPNVKAPSSSGYSYNHVHNDGSMTTYTGSGHVVEEHQGEKSAVVITEPGRPTVVVADSHGPPAPFPVFNVPNVKAPSSSGYSYNHVHNDGSMTTYTGSGHVVEEHQGAKSAVVITEPGRPTVVVADSHGPPAPFPVFNAPNVKPPSSSGYLYNHVHNDGSKTTYTGSEHLLEHQGEKSAVVITEPGRPTVVVADTQGPPAPFPVLNVPQGQVPSSPGYSYNHVYNDDSMTTYSGSGHIKEHQSETSETRQPLPLPTFITNRIETVAAAAIAARRPSSVYRPSQPTDAEHSLVSSRSNFKEQVKVNSVDHNNEQSRPSSEISSGFSYKTVHEDGSVTSYTGDDRPMLYPTGPESPLVNNITGKKIVENANCKDPAHLHNKVKKKDQSYTNTSNFSYTTVSEGGMSTVYTGSGHVERNKVVHAPHVEVANPPLLVTRTYDDSPHKVSLMPLLSPSMIPVEVKVKDSSTSTRSRKSDFKRKEVSEVPKNVFKPPLMTEEPVPTKKLVERTSSTTKKASGFKRVPLAAIPTSTQFSHVFKPKRVRQRVRTSSSISSSRGLKTQTTTSMVSSSTIAPSSEGSLSANPIVVLPEENVFSFKQERADGTSITVVGNKENKVSVVEEPTISSNRGDIPDTAF